MDTLPFSPRPCCCLFHRKRLSSPFLLCGQEALFHSWAYLFRVIAPLKGWWYLPLSLFSCERGIPSAVNAADAYLVTSAVKSLRAPFLHSFTISHLHFALQSAGRSPTRRRDTSSQGSTACDGFSGPRRCHSLKIVSAGGALWLQSILETTLIRHAFLFDSLHLRWHWHWSSGNGPTSIGTVRRLDRHHRRP